MTQSKKNYNLIIGVAALVAIIFIIGVVYLINHFATKGFSLSLDIVNLNHRPDRIHRLKA